MSMPSTSAAKHRPIWRVMTGMSETSIRVWPILDPARSLGHLRQELPQRHQEPGRIVALHGVAGARHLHPATVRKRPGELLGVLVVEDVALGAAHHQGGTGDAGNRRPQEVAPAHGGPRIDAAAVALVVLPHPLAVGHTPEVVEQAAPQQGGVASRVEGERLVHEVLDRVERRGLRREGGDLPRAGLTRLRTDVHEHEPGQPAAVGARPGQGVGPAQRHADQNEPVEPEVVDEGAEVLDVALGTVIHRGRPLAVAVAALVERDTVALRLESSADEVPRVHVEPAAVQEQHGRPASRAPVQVVEAHATEDDVVRLGQVQVGQLESGGGRRESQVLAEFLRAQAHAYTSWSTWFASGYGALSAYCTPLSISVFTSMAMRSKTALSSSPCEVR